MIPRWVDLKEIDIYCLLLPDTVISNTLKSPLKKVGI